MKIFKGIGLFSIVMFSFYYTERIANLVLENNALYQEIDKKKNEYEIQSISAIIENDTIIPGLSGMSVNVKDSYYNMKSLSAFNSYYLLYNNSSPVVSIEQNKDKIITQGNSNKNSVALILEYDEKIINYLKGYNFSVLVDINTVDKLATYEQINNDPANFSKVENILSKYVNNPNICLINNNNEKICRDNKKYLVKPNKTLSDSTILELKDNINSGDIILIKRNTKESNIEILLKSILYKDYEVNTLSKHISEER